jgi:putative ABC transport system permease protein
MTEENPLAYGPSLRHTLTEPLASLRLLGRRSLLALVGITVGCASVVALLNIGHNAANESIKMFKGLGSDIIVARFSAVPGVNMSPAPAKLDTVAATRSLAGIAHIAPAILYSTDVYVVGRKHNFSIIGTSHDLKDVMNLRISNGRFLSIYDNQSTYAVLGANAAKELNLADPIGSQIQVGNYLFEIVGILAKQGQNPLIPLPVDDAVILPIEGMRRITPTPEINSITARGRRTETLPEDATALRNYLSSLAPEHSIQIQIPQQLLDGIKKQSQTFSYLLAGVGSISLLVGGIGIMNLMIMNVSERRREIGVRMALGARPRDITVLFLLEAGALTTVGALIGATLGLIAAWVFVELSEWEFSLFTLSLPLGIVSSVAIGLFFGLYPARSAARLEPLQALRDD